MSETPLTIFMIDDDEHDAFLAQRIFSRYAQGVRLVHRADAGSVYDDIECLKSPEDGSYPDFVFLDINMPKANGLSILRKLKGHEVMRRVPVFILTTSDMQEHVELAYAFGASAYFVKPNSVEEYRNLAQAFASFWIETARRPKPVSL